MILFASVKAAIYDNRMWICNQLQLFFDSIICIAFTRERSHETVFFLAANYNVQYVKLKNWTLSAIRIAVPQNLFALGW